jgi:hypothetical protein
MTAIPPVTSVPQALPSASAPLSENPAASFEALLDNTVPQTADSPQKTPPRLFSFVALGMFGRHGAQDAPGTALSLPQTPDAPLPAEADHTAAAPALAEAQTTPAATPNALPAAAPAMDMHDADTQVPARNQTSALAQSVTLKPQRAAWKIEPQAAAPQPVRAMPSLPISTPGANREIAEAAPVPASATEAAEGFVEPMTEIPGMAAGAAAFASPPSETDVPAAPKRASPPQQPDVPTREQPDESAVALAVTDSDGALAITARSAGGGADEAVRIRRAVESV